MTNKNLTLKDILEVVGADTDIIDLYEDSHVQVIDAVTEAHLRENAWNDGKGNYILGGDVYVNMSQEELLSLPVVNTDMVWSDNRVDVYVFISEYYLSNN